MCLPSPRFQRHSVRKGQGAYCHGARTARRPTPGSVGDSAARAAMSPPMVATAGCRGAGAAAATAPTTLWTVSAIEASSKNACDLIRRAGWWCRRSLGSRHTPDGLCVCVACSALRCNVSCCPKVVGSPCIGNVRLRRSCGQRRGTERLPDPLQTGVPPLYLFKNRAVVITCAVPCVFAAAGKPFAYLPRTADVCAWLAVN